MGSVQSMGIGARILGTQRPRAESHSAARCPVLWQRWHVMLAFQESGFWGVADEIDVNWFSLTSFFRRLFANSCALLFSTFRLLEVADLARPRSSAEAVNFRPRISPSLVAGDDRPDAFSSSSSSSLSEADMPLEESPDSSSACYMISINVAPKEGMSPKKSRVDIPYVTSSSY